MWQAHQLIREFLTAVQDGCGASMVSVFVPTWPGMDDPILMHSGDEPAVPELCNVERAFEFIGRHAQPDAAGANTALATIASEVAGGTLLPIPRVTSLWQQVQLPGSGADLAKPGRRATDAQSAPTTAGWLALRFPSADTAEGFAVGPDAPGLALGQSVLGVAARMASIYLLLDDSQADPLTGLPGRSVLRALLRRELALARSERVPLSLIFFNPDEFAQVNALHGRAMGDRVLREVVSRAQATLRRSDLLCRHGAVIFAVTLSKTSYEAAAIVADKLRVALSAKPYLDGTVTLNFSAGIASLSADEIAPSDPVDFMERAESALATAKHAGGARACFWRAGTAETAEPLDRLRHAFTGDQDRDYRNMGLLWDAVGLLATSGSPGDLAERVVSQLRRALAASLVALFEPGERGLEFRYAQARPDGRDEDDVVGLDALTTEQRQAVATAAETRLPVWRAGEAGGPLSVVTCAVPLLIDEGVMGVLLLAGTAEHMKFDESDLPFMKGFGGPLGLALERARNVERKHQQDDVEKRRLVGELKGLRTALRQTRLVYVSRQIEDLMVTAHRVADTDATVLITGESGTGKEMFAQTIHQMSNRRSRPFVIVDCGAIPATLIESELFGHERGAFTGAQTRSLGRLAQADGGTILLDEIGELPLDMQSKLLRFVQEKQFTMVGSPVARHVDVRVLAATNRDLQHEVSSGRFRGDLYHRLNVIPLLIPPLRDRPEDVLELARHFLDNFAPKYQKAVRSLGAEVEDALMRYSWPGNIRELQNRILRAVIMSHGETLTLEALSLPSERSGSTPAPIEASFQAADEGRDSQGTADEDQSLSTPHLRVRSAACPADPSAAWAELRSCLASVVSSVAAAPGVVHPPLGRWLGNDLILAAFETSGRVARRGAALFSVPESTFVRRLRRAQSDAHLGRRPAEWEPVTRAVEQLVRAPLGPEQDVLGTAEAYLLEEIARHLAGNANAGASLLGTSLPTFRRRLASLPDAAAQGLGLTA